ncbi:MAG: DUF4365 domain-containing protein [Phycisphaerae bacterium]
MDSNSSSSDHDSGPLPQVHPNHDLENRSISALQNLVQEKMFFREESRPDYGVDAELEVKLNGAATNFRAKVQLKAESSVKPNQDGSISHSVATTNLNYLLNGTSSVYILYDEATKAFWYVWAHDELRRLEVDNPTWKEQKTVTLKFTQRLTDESLDDVCNQILRKGRMGREIGETLARATANEPVGLSVNPDTLEITDAAKATQILCEGGLAVVAGGYSKEVLRLLGILTEDAKQQPRIQLVAGYAEYVCGHYFNAIGHLRQALVKGGDFSAHDRNFLDSVKDACELSLGMIDKVVYYQRVETRKNNLTGLALLEANFESLRFDFLRERNQDKRTLLANSIRHLVEQIQYSTDATTATKISIQLLMLDIEGMELTTNLMLQANKLAAAAATNNPLIQRMRATASADMEGKFKNWDNSLNEVFRTAEKLQHPILIADAWQVRLNFQVFLMLNGAFQSIATNGASNPDANALGMLPHFDQVAAMYEKVGAAQSRLRVIMLKADLLEIMGQTDQAMEIAAAIYSEAQALQYSDLAERANELLTGETLLAKFRREWKKFSQTDPDVTFAALTDTELHDYAVAAMEYKGIPKQRLPVFEQYCQQERIVCREKANHCRHLNLLEYLPQTRDPDIAFTVLPNRRCVCEKHHYRTAVITSDGPALISAFKQQYCISCSDRAPKAT